MAGSRRQFAPPPQRLSRAKAKAGTDEAIHPHGVRLHARKHGAQRAQHAVEQRRDVDDLNREQAVRGGELLAKPGVELAMVKPGEHGTRGIG